MPTRILRYHDPPCISSTLETTVSLLTIMHSISRTRRRTSPTPTTSAWTTHGEDPLGATSPSGDIPKDMTSDPAETLIQTTHQAHCASTTHPALLSNRSPSNPTSQFILLSAMRRTSTVGTPNSPSSSAHKVLVVSHTRITHLGRLTNMKSTSNDALSASLRCSSRSRILALDE